MSSQIHSTPTAQRLPAQSTRDQVQTAWPAKSAIDSANGDDDSRNIIRSVRFSPIDATMLAQTKIAPVETADDFCDYSKVVVRKPWGYEYLAFENATSAVWVLYLKPGAETSMHCHPKKKTSLIVLEGKVSCTTLNASFERNACEGVLIEKGVFHQTKALTPMGAFVMEIETPTNKRDLVRLQDKYGREGKGYEGPEMYSPNLQNYNYVSLNYSGAPANFRKRFGQCSLSFKRLKSTEELDELSSLADDDVVSVLRGRIENSAGATVIAEGDTITAGEFRKSKDYGLDEEIDLLVMRRIDRLIKISDFIATFLKAQNVREVFLVPGDANVHLLDSIGRHEGLGFVCNQMEKGASMAAEGYSKTFGDLGALVISCGGSGPNAITGVANSWIDSAPILVISGQARTDQDTNGKVRQLGNKALNIVDVVKPITKYAVKITDPTTVRYHLEKAVHLARDGRPGPVWVDIPIDLQGMIIDERELKPFRKWKSRRRSALTERERDQILGMLAKAQKPVLLGGNGIRLSRSEKEFARLARLLGAPVLTSRCGADLLPEDFPFFCGRPGVYGQRRANFVLQNADLLISIGSRLSIPLIGRNAKAFARAARKIVVDVDRNELEKETIQPDVAIEMDAGAFMRDINEALAGFRGEWPDWIKRCEEWSIKFSALAEGYRHGALINPYLFVRELSRCLREQEVIVVDGGSIMNYVMQTFQVKFGQRLISSTGLELPGFALAGAIGVSISGGRREVICLCEDRGLHVSLPELQTISRSRLPMKIFNLRSRGNSTVRKIQKDFFGGRYVGTDDEILSGAADLIEVARNYGLPVRQIDNPDEAENQIKQVLDYSGPILCQVNVDSDQELIPRMGFTVREDGKWLAKPLEDMYPFLDRNTLQDAMTIDLWSEH
ncbi:MAG: hypothetical protein FJ403_20470 [Verrucomicrobia bacterium]|nr:hypothetical protein [Verrucomicrobiota bacterium]